ncbi:hypothetical protein SAMN06297251_10136 [Fulvimarina manganoxydans]|uniref:Phage-related protein n=1 Tax=Fulvimarina manganoxydans TaxID=937218 RepID=A0A1W1Y9P0_9HYPH|nr:phage tail tape measure protein [Fulvimarina manganoxydans]SMC32468.1 hypothetical protein SAMN06297251_10136 [Fulvimarina manganoxydans]
MKKRIADIVTKFRAEGLGEVRAALRRLSDETRRVSRDTDRNMGRRAFNGLRTGLQAASRGMRRLGTEARAAGRQITSVMRGAGRAVAAVGRQVFSKKGAIAAALGAAGGAAYGAFPLVPGFGALGAAGLAGVLTFQDTKEIRQASSLLGVDPAVASEWQYLGDTVGLAFGDVLGSMQGLGQAMIDSLDPSSDMAAIFKKLGVSAKDGSGRLRNVSHVMTDLARRMQGLSKGQRFFVLSQIFGEGDALKLTELFDKVGKDYGKLQKEFEARKRDKLFVSREQIDAIMKFRSNMSDLILVFKAFARELFLTFAPFFERLMKSFEVFFRNPQNRAKVIQKYFVSPFIRALMLLRDFVKVFTGFDIYGPLFGQGATKLRVVNDWLYTLKWWLGQAWIVGKGLAFLFISVGWALLDLSRIIDEFIRKSTGFSISQWLAGGSADDIAGFSRDLGMIFRNLFKQDFIDPASLETPLGQAAGRGVAILRQTFDDFLIYLEDRVAARFKQVFDTIYNVAMYIDRAMKEVDKGLADGTGFANLETSLGQILMLFAQTWPAIGAFAEAIRQVFFLGEKAPSEGFQWMEDIRTIFTNLELGEAFTFLLQKLALFSTWVKETIPKLDDLAKEWLGVNAAAAFFLALFGFGILRKVIGAIGGMIQGINKLLDGIRAFRRQWRWLRTALGLRNVAIGGALMTAGKWMLVIAAAVAAIYWGIDNLASGLQWIADLLKDILPQFQYVADFVKNWRDTLGGWIEYIPGGSYLTEAKGESNPVRVAGRGIADWFMGREGFERDSMSSESLRNADLLAALDNSGKVEQAVEDAAKAVADKPVKSDKTPIVLNLPDASVNLEATEDEADKLLRSTSLLIGGI